MVNHEYRYPIVNGGVNQRDLAPHRPIQELSPWELNPAIIEGRFHRQGITSEAEVEVLMGKLADAGAVATVAATGKNSHAVEFENAKPAEEQAPERHLRLVA